MVTQVKVLNNSSYDLHIEFLSKYPDLNIDVKQNKSAYFIMEISMSAVYIDPNYEIEKIIFYNLETLEKISELENTEKNIFELKKIEITSKLYGHEKAYFTFEVTDDILNGNILSINSIHHNGGIYNCVKVSQFSWE